jgi:hypothetical protein
MTKLSSSSAPSIDGPKNSRGTFCAPDSASVIERVSKAVTDATRQSFGTSVRAIILTGSLSRNEGSFRRTDRELWKVLGDAEFLILLVPESRLPAARDVESTVLQIEAQLIQQGVECSLSLSYCHEDFFRTMKPHMFAYETRVSGKVVSGEFDALSLIPSFTPADIPVEDAWRTLTNRMIEVAETMAAHKNPESSRVPESIAYRTMKLTLDTATSLLLFHGQYAPTYRQRADNFCQFVVAQGGLSPSTISVSEFARAMALCTKWKLSGEEPAGLVTWEWVRATCDRALAVWIWELQQLAGSEDADSTGKKITNAACKQPWSMRARGWLYVVRCEGWLRSLRYWPRWIAMAVRAAPRYWIYEATGHLFARMNEYVAARPTAVQMKLTAELFESDLPLWLSGTEADAKEWRDFARAVAWNYHRYLEGTRA